MENGGVDGYRAFVKTVKRIVIKVCLIYRFPLYQIPALISLFTRFCTHFVGRLGGFGEMSLLLLDYELLCNSAVVIIRFEL